MDVVGLSALASWPVKVNVGGRVYTIPARPALAWVVPMSDQDWLGIVPGMIADDDDTFDDLMDEGVITVKDCIDAARDAIGSASGMAWWSAVKLTGAITGNSELAGELVLQGVDASRVSIGAFLQAAYRLLVREAGKKERRKIDADLKRPPEDVSASGGKKYDPKVAANLFEQMARSRAGG